METPNDPPSGYTAPTHDLRCVGCGYGVTVRLAPERCPMCGGSAWEHARGRALDLVDALVPRRDESAVEPVSPAEPVAGSR
jgi:hypothetical protein